MAVRRGKEPVTVANINSHSVELFFFADDDDDALRYLRCHIHQAVY